ncbi:sigma 54-interacting transcriptional regulator [Bacillota bacterium]
MKNQLVGKSNDAAALELEAILEAIHEDILIANGKGEILNVSKSFEKVYGIAEKDIAGKTVFEMEREGIFKPSVIAIVLEKKTKVTMRQKNSLGRDLVVTATPIMNQSGEIARVISFTRDLTDFLILQEQYSALESQIEKYTAEIEELRSQSFNVEGIVGKSTSTQNILKTIGKIARFDANVLLMGESGVGKTQFAKLIHAKSGRSKGPFIEINCGAIPENLLESELFGYERGSFTGANRDGKVGIVELAQNGTLLLDEISELSASMQVKILKVIQDKKITRVGGTSEIEVDFRLIAASNKNLPNLVKGSLFREDLYYRLNVIAINLPPLRERREDIVPLAIYFLDKFNKVYKLNKAIDQEVYSIFLNYSWPGNVRDLENTIERLVLITESDTIKKEHLIGNIDMDVDLYEANYSSTKLRDTLEDVERRLVRAAYDKCKTTVGVAEALGISQATAVRKIHKYCKNYNGK